jgi:hypothetical protein
MGRTACTEPQCLYSRAIPLLPLWAVRPKQSLSTCTRVTFTFTIIISLILYKCNYSQFCQSIVVRMKKSCGPGNSVGIATELRTGLSGYRIPVGSMFFPRPDRPSLPTQPPVQCVPALFRGKVRQGCDAAHSPLLMPTSWKSNV